MNIQNTKLQPLDLSAVRIEDKYLLNALAKECDYLSSLEEGRLLAGFYENAGIRTPFVRYGGWESGLIGGHTLGHYLTAIAQMGVHPALPGEKRDFFSARAKRMTDELSDCQVAAGSGFLWGAPLIAGGREAQFDNVEEDKLNIMTQAWVPWYTMHKILQGVIDIYRFTGYDKALTVAKRLGDWVFERVMKWDHALSEKVLAVEYGGMNDCLYDLYSFTGEEKYALAAHRFDEETLFGRILSEEKDVLKGKHANTQIPKILGALNRYLTVHGKKIAGEVVDASRYLNVAKVFFRTVLERHTYVTGGNSEWEHFGPDYALDVRRTNCNCETCNAYNMLKLARGLFSVTGEKYYTDYYDNAFVNSILPSQNPETGMTTYFQPMASGYFKVFSRPFDKFWCCTGSGMENFSKLGDSIAYTDGRRIYLEQYLSCVIRAGKTTIGLSCNFPLSDSGTIEVSGEGETLLALRVPDWADGTMELSLSGKKLPALEINGHILVTIKAGEMLSFRIPLTVTMQGLPDGKDAFAFRYGGAVLSADLGTEDMEETETGVDVTIPARKYLESERVYFKSLYPLFDRPQDFLQREGEKFVLRGGDRELTYGLHYKRYKERYGIYFRFREGEREAEGERRTPLDTVQPGYGQYETDELHALDEKDTVSVTSDGTCRYALPGGYFSYDFLVDPQKKCSLSVELRQEDNGKPLAIYAEGELVYLNEYLRYTEGEESYRIEVELPQSVLARARQKSVKGKEVTVLNIRFEGTKERESARVSEFIYLFAE